MTSRPGLVVLALLSVGDVAGLALTDGEHPPYAVAALGAVLGLVSLVLVAQVWRGDASRLRPLVVLRVLSALTALPAFFVDNVPTAAVVAAAAIVALTALGVVLVAKPTASAVSA